MQNISQANIIIQMLVRIREHDIHKSVNMFTLELIHVYLQYGMIDTNVHFIQECDSIFVTKRVGIFTQKKLYIVEFFPTSNLS